MSTHCSRERISAKVGRGRIMGMKDMFLEPLAKPDKKHIDDLPIIDGITELSELICDGFEALVVDSYRGVCLRMHWCCPGRAGKRVVHRAAAVAASWKTRLKISVESCM
jgi:hypothetical protein